MGILRFNRHQRAKMCFWFQQLVMHQGFSSSVFCLLPQALLKFRGLGPMVLNGVPIDDTLWAVVFAMERAQPFSSNASEKCTWRNGCAQTCLSRVGRPCASPSLQAQTARCTRSETKRQDKLLHSSAACVPRTADA